MLDKEGAYALPIVLGGVLLKNPLDSLWGTVIAGFILTVILYFATEAIVRHAAGGIS
jgi:hypothetical protein